MEPTAMSVHLELIYNPIYKVCRTSFCFILAPTDLKIPC